MFCAKVQSLQIPIEDSSIVADAADAFQLRKFKKAIEAKLPPNAYQRLIAFGVKRQRGPIV